MIYYPFLKYHINIISVIKSHNEISRWYYNIVLKHHNDILSSKESKESCTKFGSQNAFREHIKILHCEKVSNCKNENECKFGPRKCWFIHQENINIAYQNAKSKSNGLW